MNKDTGGPAFPHEDGQYQGVNDAGSHGVTVRDYFATHAPPPPDKWHGGEAGLSDVIAWRWWYADAMLRERAK